MCFDRKIKVRFFVAVCCSIVCSACAPEIGLKLGAPSVPESETLASGSSVAEPLKVRLGPFKDSRPTQTLVVVDGRKVGTDGSAVGVVEEGFVRYLRQAGARIAVLNAPTIEGEILDWTARVEPSFPTTEAKASARVKIIVRDSRAHALYHATYTGEASQTHPMVDGEVVQGVLARAMGSAIEAAVSDEQLVAQLSKGRVE
jgi:hypothetical protein